MKNHVFLLFRTPLLFWVLQVPTMAFPQTLFFGQYYRVLRAPIFNVVFPDLNWKTLMKRGRRYSVCYILVECLQSQADSNFTHKTNYKLLALPSTLLEIFKPKPNKFRARLFWRFGISCQEFLIGGNLFFAVDVYTAGLQD